MSLIGDVREIAGRLFGPRSIASERQTNENAVMAAKYRAQDKVNLTAVFANKLSALTVTDSTVEVVTDGTEEKSLRAALLDEALQTAFRKSRAWCSIALGTGGVLLVPHVSSGKILTDVVSQDRAVINDARGEELLSVSILADSCYRQNELYLRWLDYSLEGETLTIRNRVTDSSGGLRNIESFPQWASIPEELVIQGVEHLPLAYIKCPVDNRRGSALYGVPVTFGCDALMEEISECLEQVRQEYALKKPIVGMDKTLFEKGADGRARLPRTGLFMPVTPGGLGDSRLWEVYDPAIRDSAYYNRLDQLYELLEKQVGTSRGILTEPVSRGATATEIKAGLYDTYSIIALLRSEIERGIERLVYGFDVLADVYRLGPSGDWAVTFDWSYALIESSQETFSQMVSAVTLGAVEPAELRQYLMSDETLNEAQARVAEIAEAKAESSRILLDRALSEERE